MRYEKSLSIVPLSAWQSVKRQGELIAEGRLPFTVCLTADGTEVRSNLLDVPGHRFPSYPDAVYLGDAVAILGYEY